MIIRDREIWCNILASPTIQFKCDTLHTHHMLYIYIKQNSPGWTKSISHSTATLVNCSISKYGAIADDPFSNITCSSAYVTCGDVTSSGA